MDQKPELIERAMHETRQSLTDKVNALEQQVVGTIQGATSAVNETVSTVKTALHDTVGAVSDSVSSIKQGVKETFDMRSHIRQNPWAAIAGAALTGAITGYLTAQSNVNRGPIPHTPRIGNNNLDAYAARSAPSKPGILDDLMGMVRQELKAIGENAVATLSATLKQSLTNGIQHFADKAGYSADESSGSDRVDDDDDTQWLSRSGRNHNGQSRRAN